MQYAHYLKQMRKNPFLSKIRISYPHKKAANSKYCWPQNYVLFCLSLAYAFL